MVRTDQNLKQSLQPAAKQPQIFCALFHKKLEQELQKPARYLGITNTMTHYYRITYLILMPIDFLNA